MKINFTKNKRDSKAWLDNVVKGKRTAKPDKKPDKKPEKKKVDFSDRAPNTQRMAAEAAYRAKRQMKTAHSLSAFDEGRL